MTDRVSQHIAAFNDSIETGDWAPFAQRFTAEATMRFVGVPAGPFRGREAIAAAYLAQPPTETMSVGSVQSSGDVDAVAFRWESGGTGTMTLTWDGDLVAELVVAFDTVE
ncbi:MAG: steroid Delta-isomerase [Pseudonocardiales bacterium]|nr:steroid Delta-isomerase [Pseudonocardiales bacterium]